MNIPVQTYSDLIARAKELLIETLGFEIWSIYFEDWYKWGETVHRDFYTENSHEPVTLGQNFTIRVALTVDDPITIWIREYEELKFARYDNIYDYLTALSEWRTGNNLCPKCGSDLTKQAKRGSEEEPCAECYLRGLLKTTEVD